MSDISKSGLVELIAQDSDLSKKDIETVLNGAMEHVGATLESGGSVTLNGFGTFSVSERKARAGRNPQTGATIQIAAKKAPSFKAYKTLKDRVNN